MNNSRTYCGYTFFNKGETGNKVKLTYYTTKEKLKEESEVYGIEVVKKEYKKDSLDEEINNIDNVASDLEKVIEIIKTLKKHKVTPVGLNDVMEDLLKVKQSN